MGGTNYAGEKNLRKWRMQKALKLFAMAHIRFGLLDFKIPDLECDYFGTSLHKFLSAPIGSGMMWIKKEKIEKIWPLVCNDNPKDAI